MHSISIIILLIWMNCDIVFSKPCIFIFFLFSFFKSSNASKLFTGLFTLPLYDAPRRPVGLPPYTDATAQSPPSQSFRVAPAPAKGLQTMLCMCGQVFRIPLRGQRLRRLQGNLIITILKVSFQSPWQNMT